MSAPAPGRFAACSIRLAAVLTAVSLARAFVRQTLTDWQLAEQVDSAELIVSELATNAVKETGLTDPSPRWQDVRAHHIIGVQLRLVDTRLYVEVWDRAGGSPVVPEQTPDAEGGRGLFLVEALSERWDVHRSVAGGKVVWARLALTRAADAPPLADLAFAQRVLDGLRRLPDLSAAG
ncbi:ATP-binding protein [Streptomyces tremellae]|uniref:Histidine kinase/HSP90-like ATPase domain-containing protein n=1 Tax=Streptomyces tremellae TaxID=1124239 RepID=A0ABP7FDJ5_9ACTN